MTADPNIRRKAGSYAVGSPKLFSVPAGPSTALALFAYALRLLRSKGRREVVRWRIYSAYGESGGVRLDDLVQFGKWCRDVGRYRTMECNPLFGRSEIDVGK